MRCEYINPDGHDKPRGVASSAPAQGFGTYSKPPRRKGGLLQGRRDRAGEAIAYYDRKDDGDILPRGARRRYSKRTGAAGA